MLMRLIPATVCVAPQVIVLSVSPSAFFPPFYPEAREFISKLDNGPLSERGLFTASFALTIINKVLLTAWKKSYD